MYYKKNGCVFSKEIRQSLEERAGGGGGDSDKLAHTYTHPRSHARAHTHTHAHQTSELPWERGNDQEANLSSKQKTNTCGTFFISQQPYISGFNSLSTSPQCYLYYIYNIYNLKKPNFQTNVGFFLYWHWSCSFRQRYSVTHYLTRRKKKNTPVTAMYI